MAAILANGVLKIRTAPIFEPLSAPARYKGSGSTKARDVPPPIRVRHAAPDGQAHSQPTDQPPSPPTHAGAASSQQSPLRFRPRRLIAEPPNSSQPAQASSPDTDPQPPPPAHTPAPSNPDTTE